MVNLERIHKDFGSITSDNVDLGGGGRLTVNLERICNAMNLEGLPLTMLILVGGQLGKDPQRLCKDYL